MIVLTPKSRTPEPFHSAPPSPERSRRCVHPGTRLMWDAATMKVTNMPDADQFIQHQYRQGWTLT